MRTPLTPLVWLRHCSQPVWHSVETSSFAKPQLVKLRRRRCRGVIRMQEDRKFNNIIICLHLECDAFGHCLDC